MTTLRKSKFGILLALLAVFGVVATPAMAFGCCCSPGGHHLHADSCHDEDHEADEATERGAHHASTGHAQHLTHTVGQCEIKDRCECQAPEILPFAASETRNNEAFSVVALAVPAHPFALEVQSTVVGSSVSDDVQRPPKPCFIPLPSRAPPAV